MAAPLTPASILREFCPLYYLQNAIPSKVPTFFIYTTSHKGANLASVEKCFLTATCLTSCIFMVYVTYELSNVRMTESSQCVRPAVWHSHWLICFLRRLITHVVVITVTVVRSEADHSVPVQVSPDDKQIRHSSWLISLIPGPGPPLCLFLILEYDHMTVLFSVTCHICVYQPSYSPTLLPCWVSQSQGGF